MPPALVRLEMLLVLLAARGHVRATRARDRELARHAAVALRAVRQQRGGDAVALGGWRWTSVASDGSPLVYH